VLIIGEATGGYETDVVRAIQARGLCIAVVNPRRIREFARASGRLAKTDAIDTKVIAYFARAMCPAQTVDLEAGHMALADLVTRRRQLIDIGIAEQNRLEQASAAVAKMIHAHIDYLKGLLAPLDLVIQQAIAEDPDALCALYGGAERGALQSADQHLLSAHENQWQKAQGRPRRRNAKTAHPAQHSGAQKQIMTAPITRLLRLLREGGAPRTVQVCFYSNGLHLLQARNPAVSAIAVVSKRVIFSAFARLGQDGRQ